QPCATCPYRRVDHHGGADRHCRVGSRPHRAGLIGRSRDRAPPHTQSGSSDLHCRNCRGITHDGCRLGRPQRLRPGGSAGGHHHGYRGRSLPFMDTFARTTSHRNMNTLESALTTTSPDTATLATRDLSLGYGERLIIDRLSVELPAARITAIVGPNGCGKSTLLAGLSRILAPRGGAVLLDGRDIAHTPTREVARRLALLPQDASAPDGLTVEELIQFGRQPYRGLMRQWSAGDAAIVRAALRATRLEALADRPLDALSGGQRQRAWIAMAVAQDTPLLLLDEPTSALDLGHQIEVLDLVRKLAREGKTVVMVIHDLASACRYAD